MIEFSVPKNALNGEFPVLVENRRDSSSLTDLVEMVRGNKDQIEERLRTIGVVLFRGFDVGTAGEFDTFSRAFEYPAFTYAESLSNAVRINHTELVFTANEAPPETEIFLHHEMAQTPRFPRMLFFFCKSAAEKGGATPICRSNKLCDDIIKSIPEFAKKCSELGIHYTTTMPNENDSESGQGRSWRSTLSVDDKDGAEKRLFDLGYTWDWNEDASLSATSPALKAIRSFDNGPDVFFNQLVAVYEGWSGAKEDPSSFLSFGDGSHPSSKELQQVSKLSKKYTWDLEWQDGDIAIVNNLLAMHGRRSYSGDRKREVLVVITD